MVGMNWLTNPAKIPIGSQYGMSMIQKNATCAAEATVASASLEMTKPPALRTEISHTSMKTT